MMLTKKIISFIIEGMKKLMCITALGFISILCVNILLNLGIEITIWRVIAVGVLLDIFIGE